MFPSYDSADDSGSGDDDSGSGDDDSSTVSNSFQDIEVSDTSGNVYFRLLPGSATDVEVEGVQLNMYAVFDAAAAQFTGNIAAASLALGSLGVMRLHHAMNNSTFRANAVVARSLDDEPSWWCKAACASAAALVLAAAAVGCGLLKTARVAAGGITFGALTVACAPLIVACNAGALASATGYYLFLLERWGPSAVNN